ncbi:MAG: OsmC family protein [Candidatus Omnitrophota bacterium]
MYKAEITSKEGYLFEAKTKDGSFNMGLKGTGATPPDVLLASLASCIGIYIRKYAEGANLELGEFCVDVEAEFGKDKPLCFKEIKATIDLKGFQLDERRRNSFMKFIENCPVHNTLKASPNISFRIS